MSRRMRLATWILVGAAGVAAVAGVLVRPPAPAAQGSPRAGQPAPEITGGPWINSEPLSIERLRGRVVLVEFWTYGCINCRNVIPPCAAGTSGTRRPG